LVRGQPAHDGVTGDLPTLKKPKPSREYWQCPSCTNRYWTLSPRETFLCPVCFTRCTLSDRVTFTKKDSKRTFATAFVVTDDSYRDLKLAPSI
jgi:hypothetical protein